jgi:hypothetical protein
MKNFSLSKTQFSTDRFKEGKKFQRREAISKESVAFSYDFYYI